MAKPGSDDRWGTGIAIVFLFAVAWFGTAPSDDQVCRQQKIPVLDALHGTDGQPTCQALIHQTEAHAIAAERRAIDLESRVEELESRLNM